ncbi:hypothetical protein MBANPS3_003415 [Mucor bainieri]
MVQLSEEEKKFKVPEIVEGSKSFFGTNPVEKWDLVSYLESSCTKNMKIKQAYHSYDNDLMWISQHKDVPTKIKDYARELMTREKPAPSLLKANIARAACKKRKLGDSSSISNNGGNLVIFNGTNHGIVSGHYTGGGDNEASSAPPPGGEERANNQESASVWKDWITYIDSNLNNFHPYSLQANEVIRAGKGVSGRPGLDPEIYQAHQREMPASEFALPPALKPYIIAFVTADDQESTTKVLNSLSIESINTRDMNIEFLSNMLTQIEKRYASRIPYNDSEDAFNQLFVWPFMDIITPRNIGGSEWVNGQPVLKSMTKQLKNGGIYVDDKHIYKTDGLIKLFDLKEQEIILVETSGSFTNDDKNKINFDHHKAVYGMLSMLKCIANDYDHASLNTFEKIKVYFLHAADENLHLWSVSYKEGIFALWRELNVHIKPDKTDKAAHVPDFVKFFWSVKCLLEQTIDDIGTLKREHEEEKTKNIFQEDERATLSDMINPIILKLTKETDDHGMSGLGSNYSPYHP